MDAEKRGFKHGDLTEKIIGVFFEVYNELGHGYLAVYHEAMLIALTHAGLKVESEVFGFADARLANSRLIWWLKES